MGSKTRKAPKYKLSIDQVGYCNPKHKSRRKGGSCLPADVVKQVKGNDICGPHDDHCILDRVAIDEVKKEELRKEYLRPRYPASWYKKKDQWLDNFQITDVMKQYEAANPWFRFMGALPMDFSAPDPYRPKDQPKQCMQPDVCNLDLKAEYDRGIRGIGFIFNLDPHFKSGSHWVAMYIDLRSVSKPGAYYFDSYGMKTPPLIARLMRALHLQIPSLTMAYNARRFQFSDSECGVYSMYFLVCMIQHIPFRKFCKTSVPDGFMLALREAFFSKGK